MDQEVMNLLKDRTGKLNQSLALETAIYPNNGHEPCLNTSLGMIQIFVVLLTINKL